MIDGAEVPDGQQERYYNESAYILVLRARCVKEGITVFPSLSYSTNHLINVHSASVPGLVLLSA